MIIIPSNLFTLEGFDGSGKSSTASILKGIFHGEMFYFTKEPILDVYIELIKATEDPFELAYLFAADRRLHNMFSINYFLRSGYDVVCDRYSASSVMYQSYQLTKHGWDIDDAIKRMIDIQPPCPDVKMCFLFECDVNIGYKRCKHKQVDSLSSNGETKEKLEFIKEYYPIVLERMKIPYDTIDTTNLNKGMVASIVYESITEIIQ